MHILSVFSVSLTPAASEVIEPPVLVFKVNVDASDQPNTLAMQMSHGIKAVEAMNKQGNIEPEQTFPNDQAHVVTMQSVKVNTEVAAANSPKANNQGNIRLQQNPTNDSASVKVNSKVSVDSSPNINVQAHIFPQQNNDEKPVHVRMTYFSGQHLPDATDPSLPNLRRIYAVLSSNNPDVRPYELPSLDSDSSLRIPIAFLCKSSATLNIKLFAKWKKGKLDFRKGPADSLLAQASVPLNSIATMIEYPICLTCTDKRLMDDPLLVFEVTMTDHFRADMVKTDSWESFLKVNHKLSMALRYIGLLVKVGAAFSEEFETFIMHNDSLLQLVQDVGRASKLVADWDDPELKEHCPNQQQNNFGKHLSKKSIEEVSAYQKQLANLVQHMKSNQQLDTQTAVFKVLGQVIAINNQLLIEKLHYAKDAGPGTSKACLPGTRKALLLHIQEWALSPSSERLLLIHGAAGKGKSAIAHSVAKGLLSQGLAIVPFFAFNHQVAECSSSQLIPTWAKNLAEQSSNSQRESLDILDQQDALLIKGLASLESGRPFVFVIDALDEYSSILSISIDNEEETAEDIHLFVQSELKNMPSIVDEAFVQRLKQAPDPAESKIFFVDLSFNVQEELVLACFKVMNIGLKFNICDLPTFFALNSEIKDLKNQVDKNISPQLQYACLALGYHMSMLTNPSNTSHSNNATTKGIAKDMKKSTDKYRDMEIILCDFMRFEKRFHEGYQLSAPQIYYSGLAFAPKRSQVLKLYGTHFCNSITVIGDLDNEWPIIETLVMQETSAIFCIAYSPNGTHIVSGSEDNTIKVWNAASGQQVREPFRGHTNFVHSVAYSPDGTHIVSGSQDMTIRVWIVESGQQVGEPLRGHTAAVSSVTYSSDGTRIVSGSWDMTIRVWDAALGQQVGEPFKGHTYSVYSVAYSPDGMYIVSGSYDETIRIWNVALGQQVGEPLRGHTVTVSSVAYSSDGTHIVSGSWDMTIRVWDAASGQQVGEPLKGHTYLVSSVAYSQDNTHIVSGSWDNTIRIWNAASSQQVGEPLRGHIGHVACVAYSPDGMHIASGSDDMTIRVWDARSGQQVGEPIRGHTYFISSVAYSPDGTHIVSGSYTPDGTQHIVPGLGDKTIRVWDASGQQSEKPFQGHTNSVFSVAYSPDGTHIVSGSDDNTIRVWDEASGQQVGNPLRGHTLSVTSVAYSPDGTHIVSGSMDGTIRVWDVASGQQVRGPLKGHSTSVHSIAYSSNGAYVVSECQDNNHEISDQTPRPSTLNLSSLHRNSDWLCIEDATKKLHILWIPHAFQQHVFSWHPCTKVLCSACQVTVILDNACFDTAWTMIKN
ncbi:hypothetical protein C0995_015695 [Termitomyces sp. Mi166|nr:hypothetical protein C0995_015695 [Termitomyces sp. Mi166\